MEKPKSLIPHALCAYICLVLFLLFGNYLIPPALMPYNAGLTQAVVLCLAVVPVFIARVPLKDVFPVKKPLMRQVGGVFLIWLSLFFVNTVMNLLITTYIDTNIIERNVMISEYMDAIPFVLSFLFIAVMPAIGEEALCRGLLQHAFRGIKSKWALFLLVGFLFGAAHMDLLVIPGTMLLGVALGLIMYETRNIVLPALFHFGNNAFAVILMASVPVADIAEEAGDFITSDAAFMVSLGLYIMLCAASPFLFYFGQRLLKRREEAAPITKKPLIICAVIAALVFIPGAAVFASGLPDFLADVLNSL